MARLGIIGFPNSGRTTVFNALTGLDAVTAPHPYATTEPNLGVARVPDDRLEAAAEVESSKKVTHAVLELVDLPALHTADGSSNGQAIGRLREMEALLIVLRAFDDPGVADAGWGTDPVSQAESLLLELALADAEVFERRSARASKEASSEAAKRVTADAIARAAAVLADGAALRSKEWSSSDLDAFRDMAPLTLLPAVWVVNVGEDEGDAEALRAAVAAVVPEGDEVISLSARIEEEGSRLDPDERTELFEGLGLGAGAVAEVTRATYAALGLISFFTVGPKESRAWTVRKGSSAAEAAGKIHSDLQRGFIRAEVSPIETVLDAGGWDAAKAAGKVRVEGRDHQIQEGDVIVVRFSV
jgi:ribosome-binding ATPase